VDVRELVGEKVRNSVRRKSSDHQTTNKPKESGKDVL
jgi:hypothetical protein